MSYLLGEMLMYLFGVAILGILIGWLFTRASYKRKVEDAEVVLLGQLHDVTKKLDITQQQLDTTSGLLELEQEHSRDTCNVAGIEELQSDLLLSQNKFDEGKQQVLELNNLLDDANQQIQQVEVELKNQCQENQEMKSDFDAVRNRLSIFQSDLDEIFEQSSILRAAFEKARLDLVTKDRRLAEMESVTTEGLQMAALTGNDTEPELAISRIARLQTRVHELFEEVNQKDKEIEVLKSSVAANNSQLEVTNITGVETDDLQQISGIGITLEEKLNEMGITQFSDIASWDDSDIDRIDQMLDFHGRIRQENWVDQAQKLGRPSSSSMRGH